MRECGGSDREVRWQGWAARLFVWLVAAGAAALLVRYALPIVLPFLIAWGMGAVIHPLAERFSRRTRLPMGLCAAVLLLLLLSLITTLLVAAVGRVLQEAERLLLRLESEGEDVGARLAQWLGEMREITSRLPFFARLRRVEGWESMLDRVDEWVGSTMQGILRSVSAKIPERVGRWMRALPSGLLFGAVTLLAGFYFSTDLTTVHHALLRLLPSGAVDRLPAWKKRLGEILRQYARAYLLLSLITFLELYIALSVLGIDYAFLIAALTALVDILPVVGVGIVLIPWAAVLLLSRQFYVGFGLLITYAAVTVVRQITEPRVVSGSLGLHPLLTLFCMYVGYRLWGLFGMMLAPVGAIMLAGGLPRGRG